MRGNALFTCDVQRGIQPFQTAFSLRCKKPPGLCALAIHKINSRDKCVQETGVVTGFCFHAERLVKLIRIFALQVRRRPQAQSPEITGNLSSDIRNLLKMKSVFGEHRLLHGISSNRASYCFACFCFDQSEAYSPFSVSNS